MRSLEKICLLVLSAAFIGGTPIKNAYVLSKEYTVTIHGTSNLHNWDQKVGTVTGDGIIDENTDGTYDVNAINIKMEVYSIKSDKGSVMNNNTYKALKANLNPQIIFALSIPVRSVPIKANTNTVKIRGNLSIAGVTHSVNMQVKMAIEKGKLLFEGSQAIKMTDYDIKPPTALLGTLKTGNEITIHFKTNFILK